MLAYYILLDIPRAHNPGGSMAYTNVWHLARWPLIVVALWLNYWSITCAVTHPTPDLARPCLTSVTVQHWVKQLRQPTTILKVRNRFSTARKKPVGGGTLCPSPSLNRVNGLIMQLFWKSLLFSVCCYLKLMFRKVNQKFTNDYRFIAAANTNHEK